MGCKCRAQRFFHFNFHLINGNSGGAVCALPRIFSIFTFQTFPFPFKILGDVRRFFFFFLLFLLIGVAEMPMMAIVAMPHCVARCGWDLRGAQNAAHIQHHRPIEMARMMKTGSFAFPTKRNGKKCPSEGSEGQATASDRWHASPNCKKENELSFWKSWKVFYKTKSQLFFVFIIDIYTNTNQNRYLWQPNIALHIGGIKNAASCGAKEIRLC